MNISGVMLKLNTILSSGAARLSSLFAAESDIQNTVDSASVTATAFKGILGWLINLITSLLFLICQFILNLIELFELTINRLLGINTDLSDYAVIDQSNPLFKILTSEKYLKVFKLVLGVSIILVIIFTIFSIVKSEYYFATNDAQQGNSKGGILKRSLKSLFVMGFFPLVIMASIILVNAILAGFNNILRNNEHTTMAAQVFAASAYNANNYRNYANDDTRIPILINFNDPVRNGQANAYSASELAEFYKRFQKKGAELYNDFADNNFASFSESLVYKNNRIYNNSNYSGFEKFVCTKEQYLVLADFIDYAVKNNLKYYVKSVKDEDINWKYVDDTIYDKESNSLTITYKDESNLNGGKRYTVVYTPTSADISTPIGDAVNVLSALLGVGEYENNTFDVLKRLEDSINVVEWETDKVFLKLEDVNNPSVLDQLLMYEQGRLQYNNSLDYTLTELSEGVSDFPVYKVTKRQYQGSTGKYITTAEYYAVRINGTFYQVEKNEDIKDAAGNYLRDDYGDPYYTLVETQFGLESVKGTKGNYYVERTDPNDPEKTITVNLYDRDVVVFNAPGKTYLYHASDDSFKDIKIDILNGTYETELSDGEKVSVNYNDTYERIIKQTSWVKKIINDLQIIYKDINFNYLLTTGDWLSNLGEYVGSQNKSESYGSSLQTGLIHPLGLILAEMFLGDIEPADEYNIYSSLDYNSKFDEETVRSFILSMLGEDRYYQLKEELQYFMEIFNIFMGPVLDEISYYENFELLSGNEQSIQLYTYKAYLASVLLSSNAANWFYETASRMLGINVFLADLVDDDGYYKAYNDLSPSNQQMLKNLLDNAKEALKKGQSLEEGQTGYPEYLKVLEAYVNNDDNKYFEGRYDYILESVKSNEAKSKDVDNEKENLKTAYNNIKNWVAEKPAFQGLFDLHIEKADSEYKINGDQSKEKDFYDELETLSQATYYKDEIVNVKNEIIDKLTEKDESGNSTGNYVLDKSGEFISKVNDYVDAVREYLSVKIDYYTEDNSSDFIGKHDQLVAERDRALFDATNIYNEFLTEMQETFFKGNPNIFKRFFGNDEYDAKYEEYIDIIRQWPVYGYGKINTAAEFFSSLKNKWNGNNNTLDLIEPSDSLAKLREYTDGLKADDIYKNLESAMNKSGRTNEEKEELKKNLESNVNRYIKDLGTYIQKQEQIDRLNRYEIVFAVRTLLSSGISKNDVISKEVPLEFDVVASNKHYTVGQNFTRVKFVEYVLGSDLLNREGYSTVFVSDDYDGLVTLEYETFNNTNDKSYTYFTNSAGAVSKFKTVNVGTEEKPIYQVVKFDGVYIESTSEDPTARYFGYKAVDAFKEVREFAEQIGQLSAELYQMTNLINLSGSTRDDLVVGEDYGADKSDLAKQILLTIINGGYLPADIQNAFFGSDIVANYTHEDSNKKLNLVLSYLLMTEDKEYKKGYVDYTKLTLKEIRKRCLNLLVNYEQQEGESTQQNQQRYLALLALTCSDWKDSSGIGALDGSWTVSRLEKNVSLEVSNQSMGIILRLAGLENRPYEEIVGAEYTIDFDFGGVDEKNGDIFIICIFDEETKTYVPFMMANKGGAMNDGLKIVDGEDESENTWYKKYNYSGSYSEYYATPDDSIKYKYYPVIAKGIIYSDGMPTAIREVDGNIEYYRDNIVIRDASDIGLEQYFMSPDEVVVNHTLISGLVNGISKIFTGKTLVEKMVESIPRFAAHTDYNFCYGVDDEVKFVSPNGCVKLSFNLKMLSSNSEMINMKCVYTMSKINILILLIGSISLIRAVWKALWGVVGRIFDIAVDIIIGPAVISTINLKYDEISDKETKEAGFNSYETWKDKIQNDILAVFAYAVGFNIFFIIIPIITQMELFENTDAFINLPLLNSLSVGFLNQIARLLFIVGAAYMTMRAPKLFASVTKTGNGFDSGASVLGSVKNTISEVSDVVSGQALVDSFTSVKDKLASAIPGSAIAKKISSEIEQRKLYKQALKSGYSKEQAKAMKAELIKQRAEREKVKKERDKKRQERIEQRKKWNNG